MIKYTVRTIAGYFKLECDLRDFEEALRIVRNREGRVTGKFEIDKNQVDEIINRIKNEEKDGKVEFK